MVAKSMEEELRDPITLAIAVLVERIRSLPEEEKKDLFELTEALASAQTDEEYDAVARGMREILRQQNGVLKLARPAEPNEELSKWMSYVGGRIRHFRENAGFTQEELAEKSGLPQSHISRLETGRHSPSSLTLERIAKAFGIAISELDPSE